MATVSEAPQGIHNDTNSHCERVTLLPSQIFAKSYNFQLPTLTVARGLARQTRHLCASLLSHSENATPKIYAKSTVAVSLRLHLSWHVKERPLQSGRLGPAPPLIISSLRRLIKTENYSSNNTVAALGNDNVLTLEVLAPRISPETRGAATIPHSNQLSQCHNDSS